MAQPTPFDTMLVQSRDLFCDRLCDAVHGMLEHADQSLTEMAEKIEDADARKPYDEARDLVLSQRAVLEKQFRARYTAEFQKRTNQAKKIALSLADVSLGDLELVTDDDLEETLKFNAMAAKVRRFCDEELGALDQRVGVLVGDATLESDANPFGPQGICDAYKQAGRHIDSNVSSRLILLRLFDDHVLDTIRASYKSVNELLVQNGILPKIRYGISKTEGGKTPPLTHEGDKEKSEAGEKAPETPQDMFSMIQKLLAPVVAQGGPGGGGPPAPGMGMGGAPLVEGADLMGSLSRLQVGDVSGVTAPDAGQLAELLALAKIGTTNVLRDLKTTSVGAGMGQVDSMTLDIVAMLFDELFDDPKIPIALKGLIGRLQLPMLKVAIADKDLFTKKGHPARQLLDTLGQIGLRLPADFDAESALFHKLETFIQELVDGFQEKMEIFDTVRGRLEEIIAEYDAGVALEMQGSQKQLEQIESLAVAKSAAQEAIAARLQSTTAPRPIVEFLAQHWIKFLLIVHAREGPESAAWKGALETVDQLLWSVEPKATVEERRKLAGTIPAILKGVRAGVAAAGIDPAACTAFFGELMKCHTDVMQAAAKPKEAPAKTKPGALTPEGAKAAAKKAPPPPPADDILDFTAPVVVDNPFGEGKIEVVSEDLDFTAAAPAAVSLEAPAEAPGAAPARAKRPRETTISLPSRLVEGAWVQIILEDNEQHPAKLHYVSPMKSHFLFVDRKGHKVYECSRSMLARRLNNLEIAILDGEPDASLFDRIMDSLFGKLGTAAPVATG